MKYYFPYESLRDFGLIEIGVGVVENGDGDLKGTDDEWAKVDRRVHELQQLQRREGGLKQVRELFLQNPETVPYVKAYDKDALEFRVKALIKLKLIARRQVDFKKSVDGKIVLNNMTHPQSIAVGKELGLTTVEANLTGCTIKCNEYVYSTI